MPRSFKLTSVAILTLAVAFVVFFFTCKHAPSLAGINPFAEDPYDAVGSAAIQLTIFTALLCLLRVFRPYATREPPASQRSLIVRGWTVSVLSVSITLVTDVVAMVKYSALWTRSSAGKSLALLVVGMALLTALTGWLILRLTPNANPNPRHGLSSRAIFVFMTCISILSVYPANWRQSMPGAIFTAGLGLVLLLLLTWGATTALFPPADTAFEDSLDDVAAIYHWLKKRASFIASLCDAVETIIGLPALQGLFRWLNPRKHRWNFAILMALALGILLALSQAIGEGIAPGRGRFALLVTIFISGEALAVLLGYGLLARYLGVFRDQHQGASTAALH